MKTKITLFLITILTFFYNSSVQAQTVTGTPSNTGCQNSGIVTASSTGLGATPQYQLLKGAVVVSPVAGDNTQFTTNPVFTGLTSGTYVVKGKATVSGTVFSSANINVTDGYTTMAITIPTKVVSCVGSTAALTSTVTNGKAPFTYKISTQAAPGTILQDSGPISANTFTFNALTVNNYIISVTDSCGLTITGATSISNPTVTINDIKLAGATYFYKNPSTNCSALAYSTLGTGFVYTSNNVAVSPSDQANFTWKLRFQNQLYGTGNVVGGVGYPLSVKSTLAPSVATRDAILADEGTNTPTAIVLMDNCGNERVFPLINYNKTFSNFTSMNCGGTAYLRANRNSGLSCFPMSMTFKNRFNPTDIVSAVLENGSGEFISGFTPGSTYDITYTDGAGYTSGLWNTNAVVFPASSVFNATQVATGVQPNLNVLGFGHLAIDFTNVLGETATVEVIASSNPTVVPVGTKFTNIAKSANLPSVNPSDPGGYWPKGTYRLQVTNSCGSAPLNVTVSGYVASLSGYTTSAVCGGFNYVMKGNFDDPGAYQVIIVSGPSNVGQVRDIANATTSFPFNGLSYGTYVFAVRIKGGTNNVLTQTVTYDSNSTIIVDKNSTGGFVCATGATNGVLTITATSNSPAPNNILEYSLSTDDGTTFSPYQSSNTFSSLTDNTYFFRIKDGCGNVITQSVQIGVAAAPAITANGKDTPAEICDMISGTVQLDIDVLGALSYLWTGPGINAFNRDLKDPLINYSDLTVGANNFTCLASFGAPCNSATLSNLVINVNPRPTVVLTAPPPVCTPNTIDITAPAITAGSDPGLTYTYFSDEQVTIPVADPTAVSVRDTYYIKGTNANGCFTIAPVDVIVNNLPVALIAYQNGPYCQTGTTLPEQLDTAGGTYSSDPDLVIDADTGEINLATSTLGTHTITYAFNDGSCSNTVTTDITINALPTAAVSYPAGTYCNRGGTVSSVVTGTTNGQYSADAGLSIDGVTGEIDLANSTPGTYTVTYAFNDGTCSNKTTTDITINATVLPSPLADIIAECFASVVAPTLTDPCAGTITATTPTVFPIITQGTSVVTWTFDYGNGYTQTVNQNVIIDDITPPAVPVLTDITAACSVTPAAPTAADACAGIITGTTTAVFPISVQGTTVITWSFDDGNGNISTADQNVIIDDITPPAVPVLTDITAACSVTPTAPTAADACSGIITGTTTAVFPISVQGTTVITWSFDDGNGNISTADQNVIIDDITPPAVPVLTDITAACSVTPTAPTAADACSGIITGTTTAVFPISVQGTTVITWSFDDGNGNISTADQNVIIDDITPPAVPVLTDITAACSVTPTAPTAADACSGIITGTTTAVFPISVQGTTVITWSFDDGNGNISTADQNVIIDDITPPAVPVLTDITASCSVTPTAPTAADACAGIITGTTTAVFPISVQGTTVITWSFDDGNGNISTADQNVIIDDITPPAVPVLTDITAACSVTPTAPTAADACSGIITGTTTAVFPISVQGTTVITWSFDDGNGNISTADQNVIIDDITPPAVPVLTDITASCSVTPTAPTAADACAGIITGTTTAVFPISVQGTTVITWSFDDGNGNISTADQNVIIDDITPPAVPVLTDITAACSVTPTAPTAADACSGIITGTTTAVFPITTLGTTVVVWAFTDGNGNTVTANQNVIISQIELNGAETVSCSTTQSGYTITLSVNGLAPYTATGTGAPGTWSGNTWTSGLISSGTNYSVNLQDAAACNTIIVSGGSPTCCVFSVTCPTFMPSSVQCYEELPSTVTLTESQFEALGNGDGRIADTQCGVIEITASNSADPGCNANVTRTYTITEYADTNENGVRDAGENTVLNTAACMQTILVHDTMAPVFTGPLPQTIISADCNKIPDAATLTASDNCGNAMISFSETRIDGECSKYSLVRTWTASDECANQNTFIQTVNVSCPLNVYNVVSPNADGKNDSFKIEGINCFPNNKVRIYNRYGVIVYEKTSYDNVTNPFEGVSDGRATIGKANKLPTGTYFYTVEYEDNGSHVNKSGYLYINNP